MEWVRASVCPLVRLPRMSRASPSPMAMSCVSARRVAWQTYRREDVGRNEVDSESERRTFSGVSEVHETKASSRLF